MKYTKEYCKGHKIACFVEGNDNILKQIKEAYDLSNSSGLVYGDEHCLNLNTGRHQTRAYYRKMGYKIVNWRDLLLQTYEIY